ncbi:hypothetical protein BDQ17DRAFT_1345070 [Cyathus striatus]|nr:hypothetical protein BDQ17DRAFT_1345070 [Cyathus striatus]
MASHPIFFKQIPIEGKGVGMTAAIDIPNYAIILTEIPLITRPSITPSTNFAVENKQIQEKLHGLPVEKQRAFLSLHRASCRPGFSNKPFLDIFTTNSFGLGEDSTQSGVFELCSRFNHSMEEVRAMRTIAAGDEITVSYLGFDGFRKGHVERQTRLKEAYGFECRCEVCTLLPKELEESDRRRTLLGAMDQEVGNGVLIMINPARALGMCKKSTEILEIEGCKQKSLGFNMMRFKYALRTAISLEQAEQASSRDGEKPYTAHMYGMDMRWKTTLKQKKSQEQRVRTVAMVELKRCRNML